MQNHNLWENILFFVQIKYAECNVFISEGDAGGCILFGQFAPASNLFDMTSKHSLQATSVISQM